MRSVSTLLRCLAAFQPQDSWLLLEDVLAELWEQGPPAEVLVPLFRFLERFPEDESGGVLMGLMHSIETFSEYEHELMDSLNRQPTEITVLLVQRIANTGQSTLAQHPIPEVYRAILLHPTAPPAVKQMAQAFLNQ